MAGRRAISKPVLYSAVVTWAGFAVYYGIQHAVPVVQNWAVQWSLGAKCGAQTHACGWAR